MLTESKLNKQTLGSFLSFYSAVKGRGLETERQACTFFFFFLSKNPKTSRAMETRS